MTQKRLPSILLLTVFVLTPLLLTFLLLDRHLQANLGNFTPIYHGTYNDSIYHWRQVFTFSQVGFSGGYYTINELPAPASFSHFYAHGPMFPLIYGLAARFVGWTFQTAIIWNCIVLTFALILYIYAVRMPTKQVILTGLTLAAFWPMLFYIPTTMQESLHFALAILVAALFYPLVREDGSISTKKALALWLLIAVAALARATWAFLFVPFYLLRLKSWRARDVILALGKSVMMIAVFGIAFQQMRSVYPFIAESLSFSKPLDEIIAGRLEWIGTNLTYWNQGNSLEITQRYIILAFLSVMAILWMVKKLKRLEHIRLPGRSFFETEIFFHLFNLGSALIFNLSFNEISGGRDYRALAPHLLLSLLMLIACKRAVLPGGMIIVHILLVGSFLQIYHETWSPQFGVDLRPQIASFTELVRENVKYDPHARNAWCNTLLFAMESRGDLVLVIPPELTGVDPGIGLSFFIGYNNGIESLNVPFKSKYLLLSEENRRLLGNRGDLELLTKTPIGDIYLNHDASC